MHPRLILEWLPGRYAVCGLDPHVRPDSPVWSTLTTLLATTFSHSQECENVVAGARNRPESLFACIATDRELSIVLDQSLVPDLLSRNHAMKVEKGFVAMRVVGTLDFSLVGVLARLTTALAQASVSVFAISTYQTDILLVRQSDAAATYQALRNVCEIQPPPSGLAKPI
jgi:hypothetical protein